MKIKGVHHLLAGLGKRVAVLSVAACAFGVAATSKAIVVFDNISNIENAVAGASANSTSSTPNTFMGDGYTLLSGTNSITGFDVFPVNNTGTNYTGLQITIYVWGGVNTGTVAAGTPAFSNLLNTYTLTSAGTFTSGFFYSFESANPGVTPGIALGVPLAISSNTVGLTFSYAGTTDGVTYATANSLSSVIAAGTPPTVGSLTLGGATGGYYRNANSEVNGNFTSTLRSLTGLTNQGLAVRVYGNAVPEPGTWALMLCGAGALLVWQARRRSTVVARA